MIVSRDDFCIPENNVVTQIHRFAYSKFKTAKGARRFLEEDIPPFQDQFACLEHVAPRITKNSSFNIYVHMLSRAMTTRRRTFVKKLEETGFPRNEVIHNHVMNSMTGDPGEIFTNRRLRAFDVIPINWIVTACVEVPKGENSSKAEFLKHMMGGQIARNYLLRSGSDKCFEVAECIFPARATDLFMTLGSYENDEDYSPIVAQNKLYKYMRRNGVDAPNFVVDLLHNPAIRTTGCAVPEKFMVWAVENLCEDLCCGAPPCNDVSISEVIDFVVRCQLVSEKERVLFWIKGSVREGMKHGLLENLCASDKEVYSCFVKAASMSAGHSYTDEEDEDEEVTSAFRPI